MKGENGATKTCKLLDFDNEEGFPSRKRLQEGGYGECGGRSQDVGQDQ